MSIAEDAPAKTYRKVLNSSWRMLRHFFPIVVLTALLGTVIENYIPQSLLVSLTANNSIWIIPIVVVIGAAIYADMIVLIEKGVNQGIVLSFMLAAAGISVPSVLLLSKVIKAKLLVYFVVTLMLLYMCLGFIFYFT
jgi:uncharacterized membrane protein YraQ (UPF0718 family)